MKKNLVIGVISCNLLTILMAITAMFNVKQPTFTTDKLYKSSQDRIDVLEKGLEIQKKRVDECRAVNKINRAKFDEYVERHAPANTKRNRQIEVLEKTLEQKNDSLEAFDDEIRELAEQIKEKNERIADLESLLDEANITIENLEYTLEQTPTIE